MFFDERGFGDNTDASAVTYLPSGPHLGGAGDDGLSDAVLCTNSTNAAVVYDAAATSSDFLQDDEVAQGFGDDDLWREFLRTLQDAQPDAAADGNDAEAVQNDSLYDVSGISRRSTRQGLNGPHATSFLLDDDDDPVLDPSFVVEESVLAQQTDNMCYHVSEKELEALLEDNEMFVRELLDKPDNYAEQYFHHHIDQVVCNTERKPATAEADQEYLKKLIANLNAMYIQLLTHVYVRYYACKRHSALKASCLKKLKGYFARNGLGDPEASGQKLACSKSDVEVPVLPFACPANLGGAFTTIRFITHLGQIAHTYSPERSSRVLNVTRRLIFVMSGVILYPRLSDDRAQQAMLIIWAENWLIAAGLALYMNETRPQSRIASGVLPSMSSQQISRRIQNVLTRHGNLTNGKGHVNPIVAWKQTLKLPRFSRNLKDKLPVFGQNTSPELQPLMRLSPNCWPRWLQVLLLAPPPVSANNNVVGKNNAHAEAVALEQQSTVRRPSLRVRRRTRKSAGAVLSAESLQMCKSFEWVQEFCTALAKHPDGYALSILPIYQNRIYAEFINETHFPIENGTARDPMNASKARYRAFIAEVDRFVRAYSNSDYRTHYTYMMVLKAVFIQRSFSVCDINRLLACMGVLRLIAWNDLKGLLALKLPAEIFMQGCSTSSATDANCASMDDVTKLKCFCDNFSAMLSKTYLQRSENNAHHRRFSVFLQLCVFLVPATIHLRKFNPVIYQLIGNVRLLFNHVAESQTTHMSKDDADAQPKCSGPSADRVRGASYVMSLFTKTLFGDVGLSDLRHKEPFSHDKKLCLLVRKFFPDAELDDLLLPSGNDSGCRNLFDEYVGRSQSAAALLTRTMSDRTTIQESNIAHAEILMNQMPVLFVTDDDDGTTDAGNMSASDMALARNELPMGFFASLGYDELGKSSADRDLIVKYALSASRAVDDECGSENIADNFAAGGESANRQRSSTSAEKSRRIVDAPHNRLQMPAVMRNLYGDDHFINNNRCLPLGEDVIYILSEDEASSSSSDGDVADLEERKG